MKTSLPAVLLAATAAASAACAKPLLKRKVCVFDPREDAGVFVLRNPDGPRVKTGWQGARTRLGGPDVRFVDDMETWRKTWVQHRGCDEDPPLVNFASDHVVAIVMRSGCARDLELDEISEEEKQRTIAYRYTVRAECRPPKKEYIFLVLPRSDKRLVVKARWYAGWPSALRERVVAQKDEF